MGLVMDNLPGVNKLCLCRAEMAAKGTRVDLRKKQKKEICDYRERNPKSYNARNTWRPFLYEVEIPTDCATNGRRHPKINPPKISSKQSSELTNIHYYIYVHYKYIIHIHIIIQVYMQMDTVFMCNSHITVQLVQL